MGNVASLDVQRFIERLPDLSPADRNTIAAKLKFLNGHAVVTTTSISLRDDWLLDGVIYELGRRGLTYKGLNHTLLGKIAPDFIIDSQSLRARLTRVLSSRHLKDAELIKFGRIAARALADYLGPVTPISLKTLLQNINKLPEAIDNSFPGYLEAGVMIKLIEGMVR